MDEVNTHAKSQKLMKKNALKPKTFQLYLDKFRRQMYGIDNFE
jgi:hypothetical protein